MFKPCLIFPCYNHSEQFERFLQKLLPFPCPAIVVDDGSVPADAERLQKLARDGTFTLIRLETNKGKGEATRAGFEYALNAGLTHFFQIDSDGQHDPSKIKTFLEMAEKNPESAIFGAPQYDASVPKSRMFGRKITNFFIAIETLSLQMKDALCGFRIYPATAVTPLMKKRGLWSARMGFDPRILVEMHWAGTPIIFLPIPVIYPEGGHSNFSLFSSNVALFVTHTKLCNLAPFKLAKRAFRRRKV